MAPLIVVILFATLAAVAAAFVALPAIRSAGNGRARVLLASATALAVIGVGAGFYVAVGRPELAMRAFKPAEKQDLGGLISLLVERVHAHPDDETSWVWLGRAYQTAGDAEDSARALSRAVSVAKARHALSPELLAAYGEALVRASDGEVTPEAQSAFEAVLATQPKNPEARYFLGYAYAEQGSGARAIALWQSLIADFPDNTALRSELTDKIAALSAKAGTAPDVGQMIEGLSERLKAHPDDPEGWLRLVKALSVLGKTSEAEDALKHARVALAANPDALRAIEAEARTLKLGPK